MSIGYAAQMLWEKRILRFAEELGDLRRLFPDELGSHYKLENDWYVADGRAICFRQHQIVLMVGGTLDKPAPWDGGVQDALLKTVATELLPHLVGLERERWTNTPFEENDPPPMGADAARASVLELTEERVFVEAEVDYFSQKESANPDLELWFRGTDRAFLLSAKNGGLWNHKWIPSGSYRVGVFAKVYSQPLAKWTGKNKRFDEYLWSSPIIPLELRRGRTYRFAIGLPVDKRALTEEERAFIQSPEATLPKRREILEVRVVEDRAQEPYR